MSGCTASAPLLQAPCPECPLTPASIIRDLPPRQAQLMAALPQPPQLAVRVPERAHSAFATGPKFTKH